MNDQYKDFFNQGIGSLLGQGNSKPPAQSLADYQMQKLALMQEAKLQSMWQQPIQPPAPDPVLLLCGDEE